MGKDRLDMTLEAMREDLIEYINDENLDILDEFSADVLANEVISIAQRLMVRDFCNGHLIKHDNRNIDYLYSIDNSLAGVFYRTRRKVMTNPRSERYEKKEQKRNKGSPSRRLENRAYTRKA